MLSLVYHSLVRFLLVERPLYVRNVVSLDFSATLVLVQNVHWLSDFPQFGDINYDHDRSHRGSSQLA